MQIISGKNSCGEVSKKMKIIDFTNFFDKASHKRCLFLDISVLIVYGVYIATSH